MSLLAPGPIVALLGAASLTGLSACGTGTVSTSKFAGASRSVGQTVSDLQNDAQTHNQKRLCQQDLASNVVAALGTAGHTCTGVLTKQLGELDVFDLTLESVSFRNGASPPTAAAVVKDTQNGKPHLDTLTLVRQGVRWKVSGIVG